MVSVIAKNIRSRREHKTLCELFEKADATGDGTISIEEYILMCDTYGIELSDEHVEEFRKIADSDGEVRKNDFIRHIKQLNIGDQFSALDNDSDQYWHNVAVTAFKLFDVNFDGFIDKKEFRWMTTSELVSWKTIDLVFERCDLDRNGKLDYQEFKAMIFRSRQRKEALLREQEEQAKLKGRRKSVGKKKKKVPTNKKKEKKEKKGAKKKK